MMSRKYRNLQNGMCLALQYERAKLGGPTHPDEYRKNPAKKSWAMVVSNESD